MNKTMVNQVLIAVTAMVAANLILDYVRKVAKS
jgi:hypothetical protein